MTPATGRVTSTDSAADVPTFLWADRYTSPRLPLGTTPEAAARHHLASFASYYRMTPEQAQTVELRDVHDTGRGALIARFARRVDGIEVFNEVVSVSMDRHLDPVVLTGYVTGDQPAVAKQGKRASSAFTVDNLRAVASAVDDLAGIKVDVSGLGVPAKAGGDYQTVQILPSLAKAAGVVGDIEPARTKQVFYRQDKSLVPAYYVEVDLGNDHEGNPRYWAYIVSGSDGAVLNKWTLSANDFTYRVYADEDGLNTPWDGPHGIDSTPHPDGIPNSFQPGYEPAVDIALNAMPGFNDPWLPAGSTETVGNNVDAYLDLSGPDGYFPGFGTIPDFRGAVTDPGQFLPAPYDHNLDAATDGNRKAGVVQLFYNINWLHDFYYLGGFNEAAGNAQFSNYGRGGLDGDGIRGEAQDSGGRNNANMSTPADGARPRMQMYLWDRSSVKITVAGTSAADGDYIYLGTAAGFGLQTFNLAATPVARANPIDGCAALVGDYVGKVVLVDRGGAEPACGGFFGKATRVVAAGGVGIIIANVATSSPPNVPPAMGGSGTGVGIPVLSMNFDDAELLRAALTANEPMTATMSRAPLPSPSGDIDNQIVAHEWGHYISNRLIFNSAGLQFAMARGLGEGWADFHAVLMTVREGDSAVPGNEEFQGAYAMAGYATSNSANSYYFGIRRYPYSTDIDNINPLRLKYISDVNPLPNFPPRGGGGVNSQFHNTGEVWASMLWECYASLLRVRVLDLGDYDFNEARDRMRDYLVAAYKMTPANPTILEARDAVLAAALMNDADDYELFTQAFAKRGAGAYASVPPRETVNHIPVVESEAFGPAVVHTKLELLDNVTAVCLGDGILDNGETGTIVLTFRNIGHTATAATTASVSSPTAEVTIGNGGVVDVPALAPGQTGTGSVQISLAGLAPMGTFSLEVTNPDLASEPSPTTTYTFRGEADEAVSVATTDDTELSRTLWAPSITTAVITPEYRWRRDGQPGLARHHHCSSAPVAGAADLTSPAFAVASGQGITLEFKHRYSFEFDTSARYDGGIVEITTDNGVTWANLNTIVGNAAMGYDGNVATGGGNPISGAAYTATSLTYPTFLTRTIPIPASAVGGKVVRVRFRVGSDSGVASTGWDVDDIKITGATVAPFDGLVAQDATCDLPPIANAGININGVSEFGAGPAFLPFTWTLDGSSSFDPDGDALTYAWTQISGPTGSLSSAAVAKPVLTMPEIARGASPVQLWFQLVVTADGKSSTPKYVFVQEVNTNRPPTANAGPAQSVNEGATVNLTGAGSTDPDIRPDAPLPADPALTYSWTAAGGNPTVVVLTNPTSATPSFTAPQVTAPTNYTFNLVVNDGVVNSASSSVVITVNNQNKAPVANAGPDQTVAERTEVTLTGAASSDPDGDTPLTYAWTAPEGITLSDATAASPTFTAPDVPTEGQDFTFSLIVSDPSSAASTADSVVIHVTNVNRQPVADAGEDADATSGTVVVLDGSGTDPDGDAIVGYEWTAPAGITLNSTTSATPSFTAPTVTADTTYTFSLEVTDALGMPSEPDQVVITVKAPVPPLARPVADAGHTQAVATGAMVTLDGSGSTGGGTLTYAWTQTGGATVTLTGANTAMPTFTAPSVINGVQTFEFQLVVSNAAGASAPSRTTVVVTPRPVTPPTFDDFDSQGCGCSVGKQTKAPSALVALLGLPLLLLVRRRRR